jgi:NTP pyrophosphatase (non-canonical NTP hydrolase)
MSLLDSQEVGLALLVLAADQSEWSQRTFGTDAERGPIGSLRHLAGEAGEAEQAWNEWAGDDPSGKVREELADCFLLILDAARRSGVSPLNLIRAAQAKMVVNRGRKFPATFDPLKPTEHIREEPTR